jgi:alpha,alpha-trehalase
MSEVRDAPPVYPLRNYALLADGERGALVDPAGNVAWMCAPRWHDPALFSTLVGGLKQLAECAPCGVGDRDAWLSLADAILGDCSERFVHRSGRWQRSPGDERVDASLLLGALRGAIPPDDPRSRATMAAVLSDLGDEHHIYRFRHDEDAPLGEAEGAFLLCGFWAALACRQQGAEGDALRFFERARSAAGSPGLLSEEFDVDQHQLRGNLPQAFVHALLLECAATLAGN